MPLGRRPRPGRRRSDAPAADPGRRAALLAGAVLVTAGSAALVTAVLPLLVPEVGTSTGAAALSRSWGPHLRTGPSAGPPTMPTPRAGQPFAVLRVPRFGADYSRVIAQGTDAATVLDTGALGHYTGTALPGAIGNFVVAGHRAAAGGPLLHLPSLRRGDLIVVDTARATYRYRVTGSAVVAPTDVDVVAPVPGHPEAVPTERLVTLQTCTPPLIDTDRYVVHGRLQSATPRAAPSRPVAAGSASPQ